MVRNFASFPVKHATPHDESSPIFAWLLKLCPVTAAILLLAPSANAAEWTIKPNLGFSESYSDNIRRATLGNEQGDWITQISPGFSMNAAGPRLMLTSNYTMQNLLYGKSKQYNSTRHNLSANAHAELVNNLLFLDGTASISQQNTSTLGPQALNNFTITNNRADVTALSISPTLKHRFQGWANSEIRYTHGIVNTNAAGLANNQTDGIAFKLNSGTSFTNLRWGLHYNKQKSSYGNIGQAINNQTYAGNLGYMVTPRFSLNASAGYEKSDYISIAKQPQGPHYSAGFIWAPSQRTNIDASIGRRFYGNSYSLNARHRSRKTTWGLGYSEDITTTQSQFLINTGLPAQILPGPANFLSNRVFLQKSLTASATLHGQRNSLTFNLFDVLREAQTSQTVNLGLLGTANQALSDKSKQLGGNVSWNYQLSPYTSTSLTAGYTKNSFPAANITTNDKNLQLGVTSKLQADFGYSISLRHNQHKSSLPNSDSRENSLTASLLMQF